LDPLYTLLGAIPIQPETEATVTVPAPFESIPGIDCSKLKFNSLGEVLIEIQLNYQFPIQWLFLKTFQV
jgi:hypothetical protein